MVEVSKKKQIEKLVKNVLRGEEYDLYEIEWGKRGERWRLAIYITSEGEIRTSSCEKVSKILSPVLDKADLIDRSYELEVSSPGIERPLNKPRHFEAALGERVQINTYAPIENERSHIGILVNFSQDKEKIERIELEIEGHKRTFLRKDISKATTKPQFEI